MKRSDLLLPWAMRLPGFVLVAGGTLFGIIRFWFDIKPRFLQMKVFAVYSEYLGEKYLHFIRDNMIEELTGVMLVLGAWMIALSREKTETEETAAARNRAFVISAYLQIIFLLGSLLLTYGIAFLYMSMMYLVLPPALYYLIFRILISRRSAG